MMPIELVKPWRIIACLIPCLYAGLLIWQANNSRMLILIAAAVMLVLVYSVSALGYPLSIFITAFAGTSLLLACIFVLYAGLPSSDLTSTTRTPLELWVALPLALGYIGWGVLTARRFMYYV